jgi:ABC-type transport system involved in multi-copper enzyme maturation permease subunit
MRLSGLNPLNAVVGLELRAAARRKGTYWLRFGFVGVFVIILALMLASESGLRPTDAQTSGHLIERLQQQSRIGQQIFVSFVFYGTIGMGFIGPLLTCSAVGAERLGRTLPVLLATPLSSWQIISGKLLSRMITIGMLMVLAVPVLAMVGLMGGVEPLDMFLAVLLMTSVALGGASLSLLLSTLFSRAYIVILAAYGFLGLFYVGLPIFLSILSIFGGWGRFGGIDPEFMLSWHPISGAIGLTEDTDILFVPAVLTQWIMAGICLFAATCVLRRGERDRVPADPGVASSLHEAPPLARVVAVVPSPVARSAGVGSSQSPPPLHAAQITSDIAPNLALAQPLAARPPVLEMATPGVRLDSREVSDRPVMWRETNQSAAKRWLLRLLVILPLVMLFGMIYSAVGRQLWRDAGVQVVFAGLVQTIFAISVCVLSATLVSRERESDTWTLLLATPLSAWQIVTGKLLGLFHRVWPIVAFWALHLLIMLPGEGVSIVSMGLSILLIICLNAPLISLGLWLSLRVTKTTPAVVMSLIIPVLWYVLLPLGLMVLGERLDHDDNWGKLGVLWQPYFLQGQMLDRLSVFDPSDRFAVWDLPHGIDGRMSELTYVIYVVAVCAIHLAIAGAMLLLIVWRFDQLGGRARSGHLLRA